MTMPLLKSEAAAAIAAPRKAVSGAVLRLPLAKASFASRLRPGLVAIAARVLPPLVMLADRKSVG